MRRAALATVASGALLLGGALFAADLYIFLQRPALDAGETAIYEIPPGASVRDIALELERRRLVTRPWYWLALARLQGKARSIKAGEYHLRGPLTPQTLLERLVTGETRQFSLTLIEGWSFRRVMDALASHPQIEQTLEGQDDVMALLDAPGQRPEGWFFPDTYYFPRNTSDLAFLRRSHETMKAQLKALWQSRDKNLPLRTPYEALILASIVEKETAAPQERPVIAAVFLSRLRQGMRLQADPTVVYGLGEGFDGDISYNDLRLDTPFNTYLHKGLTPTPIAMPGKAALEAVLHPAKSDALFFVARRDGRHHFSATYEEHRKAVIEHQLDDDAGRYNARGQ